MRDFVLRGLVQYSALPLLALGCAAAPVYALAGPAARAPSNADGTPSGSASSASQILVIGHLPAPISEASEAIVDITSAPIERIENTLRDVAGLQQFRRSDARSANPTSQGVTLRGLGGNASSRALLFVDGVPQADPFGGWISWPQYDALDPGSVRVRRGGGQPSLGPGALAGTIEIDSRQWPQQVTASAAYGSRNSVIAKANALSGSRRNHVSIGGSFARGDGFIPVVARQRGSVDRAAEYRQGAMFLRAAAPVSGSTELQANLRAFFDERERGFEFSDNQNSGVDASIRAVNRSDGWQWSALGYVQLREFATRFGSIADDRNAVRLVLDQYSVPSTGLGARAEIRPPVGGNAEIRIGGDWRRSIGATNERFFFIGDAPQRSRKAGGRTDTYGGFVEGSWKPDDRMTLSVGGRVDRWHIANGSIRTLNLPAARVISDIEFADRKGWVGSGRAGFAWTPDANRTVTLRGAAYLGWRLPTLNELYRPFRVGAVTTSANALLKPEQLRGGEIGVDFGNSDPFKFSVTAFWNELDDAVANVTLADGSGNRQRQNLRNIQSKGVEFDARYEMAGLFGMNIGRQSFVMEARYAYVDARVRGGGAAAALDNLRPAQVPSHSASFGLGYDDRPGFKAGISMRYYGAQFEDDMNSRLLADAVTLDAWAGHAIGGNDGWTVELRAENLFGQEVQAGLSSSDIIERANPRTIWLGLRTKI